MDKSKRAERILSHVEELARRYNAKVIFLRVVRSPHITSFVATDMLQHRKEVLRIKQQAELYLKGLQREFREKGIEARIRIIQAPVVPSILEAAA